MPSVTLAESFEVQKIPKLKISYKCHRESGFLGSLVCLGYLWSPAISIIEEDGFF